MVDQEIDVDALPRRATVSKAGIDCLPRQHNMVFCRDFDGSDGTRTRDLRRDRCDSSVSTGFA